MSHPYSISKTSFIKFEQCEKAFFLYKNHPYLRDKPDTDRQITFQRGHDVGAFAHGLFPGGRDVSAETKSAAQALELTAKLIAEKSPVIYEATFVYNGVLIMIDILTFNADGYAAYEVKSSMKVSETYIKDACLQYYVLKNCLPQLQDFFLVTVNGDYILEGETDPRKFFKKRSVKQKAEENFSFFDVRLRSAHELLEQNVIPNTAIGKQCFRPYLCDFFGSCWKNTMTDDSIFNLPLINKDKLFELHDAGIRNIGQVTDAHLEKEHLIRIKNAFINGAPVIDQEKICEFMSRLKEPLAAMDMEIWNPAIPVLQGGRPFEQIPFLVCFYDGMSETHFFTEHQLDERRLFAEKLLELSRPYSTILVYDKTMEVIAIDNLAKRFEDLKEELLVLKSKLADVFDIFLNLHYYDPAFKSNFSLKTVSGLLVPDISYSGIASGMEAMSIYENYRRAQEGSQKKGWKTDLIRYCTMDSNATFKVTGFLKKLVNC